MNSSEKIRVMDAIIEFFESSNKESDQTAKSIIESDFENKEMYAHAVSELLKGADWTGLRTPEADILLAALTFAQEHLKKSVEKNSN